MQHKKDVIIIGGGLAGAVLARALGLEGFQVCVIDAAQPLSSASLDPRTSALAASTYLLFKNLGIWPALENLACPIKQIIISEESSKEKLYYESSLLASPQPMGYMVANAVLRQVLHKQALETPNVEWIAGTRPVSVETTEHQVVVKTQAATYSAPLLVGADGQHSWVRQQAKIKVTTWDYHQKAMVCLVRHPCPHHNQALEHFTSEGPLALLPMVSLPSETSPGEEQEDNANGLYQSAVVWSASLSFMTTIEAMSDQELGELLSQRLSHSYGGPLTVGSKRTYYPLGAIWPHAVIARRLALVGDAAHTIHPVAGQGINLGFRDVAALVEVLKQWRQLGLDLGSHSMLSTYSQYRRWDNTLMLLATDSAVRAFSNKSFILRPLRKVGLKIVNSFPGLKRSFMHHAMGLSGVLPALLREKDGS